MRVGVAVLTHNTIANGRQSLLKQCWRSLEEADQMIVVDNGSTDGTTGWLDAEGLPFYRNVGRVTTSGAGTNLQGRLLAGMDVDLCVMSDDDMVWHEGWRDRLERWWASAPDDVILAGCHLEPEFAWNEILGTCNGALVRVSTGAASWSFRQTMFCEIGPLMSKRQGIGDVPKCNELVAAGWVICQLDLASHCGVSTWGNGSSSWDASAVEVVRAKLEGV